MRVLVCGGRGFNDRAFLDKVLNELDGESGHHGGAIDVIIEGCAKGADHLAFQWATNRRRGTESYPADWATFGRKAGPMRNAAMLRDGRPDVVVAFSGGKGTADMVRRAKAAGLRVIEATQTGGKESDGHG